MSEESRTSNEMWLREYFRVLRFDGNNHLGLGDIRLTIGQQEEIVRHMTAGETNAHTKAPEPIQVGDEACTHREQWLGLDNVRSCRACGAKVGVGDY